MHSAEILAQSSESRFDWPGHCFELDHTMPSHRHAIATLFMATFCTGVHAGAVYGTVRTALGPLAGVKIQLACPGFVAGAQTSVATSDVSGSYALRLPISGRCLMRVQRGSITGTPFEVFLFDNPIRFDFTVGQQLQKLG